MNYRAAVTTRVTLDQDRIINTGTVTVFGILVANSTAFTAEIDFQDATGNNKMTVTVPCFDSIPIDTEFIADGGLLVDGVSDANVIVTVWHSHEGS